MTRAMELPTEQALLGPTGISPGALTRSSSRAALLALVLLLVSAATAQAAPSPWWQIITESRPTNLWSATDNEQEIETELSDAPGLEGAAARIDVGGQAIGCLGSANSVGEALCGNYGFPVTETALQLAELLESTWDAAVVVSGGPVGGEPFKITVPGRAAPRISFFQTEGLLGTFSANVLAPGGSGRLGVSLVNLGDAPLHATSTPLTILDQLPEGLEATRVEASGGFPATPLECELPSPGAVSCSFEGVLSSYQSIEVEIFVSVTAHPPVAGAPGKVTVSGGDGPSSFALQKVEVSPEEAPFDIENFSVTAEEEGGDPERQAGSHPFQVTSAVTLAKDAAAQPVQPPKGIRLRLPPELLANAARLPRCASADFFAETCPLDSVIGAGRFTINDPTVGIRSIPAPIFNLLPARGEPARFGMTGLGVPVLLNGSLDPASGAATLTIANLTQVYGLLSTTLTFWGVPGDPRHDSARGFDCLRAPRDRPLGPCQALADPAPRALFTLPAFCSTPLSATLELSSWNAPHQVASATSQLPALSGCDRLPFSPRFAASATTAAAHAPTGLDLKLELDHLGALTPGGLATASIASAQVTLPEGLTLNPALAAGLGACGLADLARETLDSLSGQGCPEAARVGTAEASSPLFPGPISGVLYVATPYANRAGDARFALYAVFKNPARGLFFAQPLRLDADPTTGRITANVLDPPRLPIERLGLHFDSGPRAPLTTPPCGFHRIAATLEPGSGAPPVPILSGFSTDRGCDPEPFAPTLSAGTVSNLAGRSSPFVLDLQSDPTEPNPAAFELALPPGLSAAFAGAATCPEDVVADAECPPASRLGFAQIAIGPGPEPLWIPEAGGSASAVYLAGPYMGAPYSLLIRLPAQAGPFDLGTVVLRAAVEIDPWTAQATVRLAGLPQILAGVPIRYRDIRLILDRPGFIRNPTSCEPAAIEATATSASGETAPLRSRFEAADCAALPFKPRLRVRLSGALGRNGHPRIEIQLTRRSGGANLAAAAFTLPAGELLDTRHIRALCGAGLAPGKCPAASRLGDAVIRSPLLPAPLRGPVFLRTPSHRYPDLLAVLRGGGLSLRLVGTAAAAPGGRLRLRLVKIPDLPLSRATLTLDGGRRGIFVNSTSLCGHSPRAEAQLDAHNGRHLDLRPRLMLHGPC